jgi:hypothetical protein
MILRTYKGKAKSVGKQQVKSQFLLYAVKKISKDFPILREARREVLEDLMDINNAKVVLEWIKSGKLKVKIKEVKLPSPFALNLILQGHADLIRIEDEYKVYIRGKILKDSFTEYFKNVLKKEIGEIKITFVNLEGSRKGIDIDFAKKLLSTSNVPIIFEGGLSNLSDIEKAITAGIESIALGTMLVFSDNNIFKIKQFLQNRNIPVRLRD